MSAHVVDELSAYLDGELAPADADRVRRHLEACADCRAELQALRDAQALLRSLPEVEPPASLRTRVLDRVRRRARPAGAWRRLPVWITAGAVAAAAVGFALQQADRWRLAALGASQGAPADEAQVAPGAVGMAPPGVEGGRAGMTAADTSAPRPMRGPETLAKVAERPETLPPAELGRKVALSAEFQLESADVAGTARAAEDAARALGGFVQEALVESRPGGVARMVLRVPAARFPELDRRLHELAEVRSRRIGTEDVTSAYVDAESRLRNLRAQEQHLLTLLERARTVDETLRVEQELWRIRGEIEMLTGQLRAWDRMVELATVHVEVVPEGGPREAPPGSIRDRLRRAWRHAVDASLTALESMLVGAGFLAPWMLLLGAGTWAYRRLRGTGRLEPPA